MEHCTVFTIFCNIRIPSFCKRRTRSISQCPSITEDLSVIRHIDSSNSTCSRSIRTFFIGTTYMNPLICTINSSSSYSTKSTSNCHTSSCITSISSYSNILTSTRISEYHPFNDTRGSRNSNSCITNKRSSTHSNYQEGN